MRTGTYGDQFLMVTISSKHKNIVCFCVDMM